MAQSQGKAGSERRMVDIVSAETRSRMMSRIRARDTLPELTVRRYLHARGFRYRLDDRRLPGRPDIVLRKWKTVIFVHGCFWHGHPDCRFFRMPDMRRDFWSTKIDANVARDQRNMGLLLESGWRVAVVWECALRDELEGSMAQLDAFLLGSARAVEIRSESQRPARIE